MNKTINIKNIKAILIASLIVSAGAGAMVSLAALTGGLVTITVHNLPKAVVGEFYHVIVDADGGADSYAWGISKGSLPPGLHLTPVYCLTSPCLAPAVIEGFPTEKGSYGFDLLVYSGGFTDTEHFVIHVR